MAYGPLRTRLHFDAQQYLTPETVFRKGNRYIQDDQVLYFEFDYGCFTPIHNTHELQIVSRVIADYHNNACKAYDDDGWHDETAAIWENMLFKTEVDPELDPASVDNDFNVRRQRQRPPPPRKNDLGTTPPACELWSNRGEDNLKIDHVFALDEDLHHSDDATDHDATDHDDTAEKPVKKQPPTLSQFIPADIRGSDHHDGDDDTTVPYKKPHKVLHFHWLNCNSET